MRYVKAKSITELLGRFLREEGLETPLNEYRVIQAWPLVVGEPFSQYTKSVKMYNQTLYVEISHPVVRQELLMRRTELLEQLNHCVGAHVVYDIRIS
ncbi:MAG: DUF721 domain-containing protein [Prevotellaceae bacterium]|nr:DUF721 domain-containing protein [Prevotellaceae bacterium]MDD7107278.1 DUF721 domain-containing protein [Prevotellaceae bacterium]